MLYGFMIIFGSIFAMYPRTLIYLKGSRGLFLWLMGVLCVVYGITKSNIFGN